jgi:hypothetical protein
MIRTQIYIPDDMHADLSFIAKQKKTSFAEVARVLIKKGLSEEKVKDVSGKKALANIIDMKVKGGPRDLSLKIDSYLYE